MSLYSNDADKAKKANTNQPFTVVGWKYNADGAKERVGMSQPYTVMAWKYNVDDAKERVGIDQPYTVWGWNYNTDSANKEKVKEAYKPLSIETNTKKTGIDQPYTVWGWNYNTNSANKEKVKEAEKPLSIETNTKKTGVDQPYTVWGWNYNTNNANKEKVKEAEKPLSIETNTKKTGIDQPYTVWGWNYNTDSANKEKVKEANKPLSIETDTKKTGIDQPYTVWGWNYNTDSANKEKVKEAEKSLSIETNTKKTGIDQPYTVWGWNYNTNSGNKEKVKEADKVFTMDTSTKKAGTKQPYTVMGWKYNADNGKREKVGHEVSVGSVFFIEKSLRLGDKLKHDFQKTPSVPFLPKHIAKSIPFSEDKFTEILNLFSIKPGSVEATGIKGTLDVCLHRPKVEKENRTCAQSMEDVVDFVVRELGSNDVELRMMKNDIEVPKGIQDYVITKVKKLVVPGNTAAACHRMSYPYVVYYCHHQQDIGHYDVTLVSPTTGNAIQTTAVCHYDTYAWKPNVPALQYLGIRPGDAPVCHFSAINDMFWSLKANSKSLDMVV
uniref:BURP domain-containing protein n=1 Tax=Chenopodium quinoa TaxID=63459 RepID=A0A803LQ66_CHEQI